MPYPERRCEACGQPVRSRRASARHCSAACRMRSHRAKRSDELREALKNAEVALRWVREAATRAGVLY